MMSSIITKVIKTVRERPFYFFKYTYEALAYSINYCYIRLAAGPNIQIGKNPHVLNPFCFNAERPKAMLAVGDHFTGYYGFSVNVWGPGKVSIGNCCSIGSRTRVDCRQEVTFGNHVLISWDVLIADYNPHSIMPEERSREMEHSTAVIWPQFDGGITVPERNAEFQSKPVRIEDEVWIGARAIILKGVTIGRGSIIGAGAVVSDDIPPFSIAVGNPARVVKTLLQKP